MNKTDASTPTTTFLPEQTIGQVYLLSQRQQPTLEIYEALGQIRSVPFVQVGPGRAPDEWQWRAEPPLPRRGEWQFRINLGHTFYRASDGSDHYHTCLHKLWLQDGQIFNYPPAPQVSPSQVIKISKFSGSLSPRDLYVYLPRGYAERSDHYYPLLFMHDGQNCFQTYVEDSFAGSWRAEETADRLISQGRMQECIIVGVSHGQQERLVEYLPPYVRYRPPAPSAARAAYRRVRRLYATPIVGQANRTAAYYRYEVAPYIRQHYRAFKGREHTATCGSSMGGLFSIYLAWERTDFARCHAALSPSFWITRAPQGRIEAIERLRCGQRRDIRLWLDSGDQDTPGEGDDGLPETRAARDALLENGYVEGRDFRYYLDEGASHSEAAWAKRLPLIFEFLFPLEEGGED